MVVPPAAAGGGVFGLTGAGAGAGGAGGAVTVNGCWHFGHLTRRPRKVSGTRPLAPQCGQTVFGMASYRKALGIQTLTVPRAGAPRVAGVGRVLKV